jgi:polyphosphate kinase
MPRNFDRRVEVMFPIESEDLRRQIVDELIPTYLGDNVRTRVLRSDGTYVRASAGSGAAHRSQYELLQRAALRDGALAEAASEPLSFDAITALAEGNGEAGRLRPRRKKKTAR